MWSALRKCAASSQGTKCKGFSPIELVLGVEGGECRSGGDAHAQMGVIQFIIDLGPWDSRWEVLWVGKLSVDQGPGNAEGWS